MQKWQEFASWQHFFSICSNKRTSRPLKQRNDNRHSWESTMNEILRLLQFQTERKIFFSDDHSRQHWNPSHWGFGRGDNHIALERCQNWIFCRFSLIWATQMWYLLLLSVSTGRVSIQLDKSARLRFSICQSQPKWLQILRWQCCLYAMHLLEKLQFSLMKDSISRYERLSENWINCVDSTKLEND